MQFSYEYNGEVYKVELSPQPDGSYKARIGERELTVQASETQAGSWLLYVDGQRYIARSVADQEARHVHINGTQYTLERMTGRRRRSTGGGGAGRLVAEMPGQVIDVRVKAGDVVESGQVLVVLEAMKMEIRVTAPGTGTISEVLVAAGDVVERGQRLVELDSGE